MLYNIALVKGNLQSKNKAQVLTSKEMKKRKPIFLMLWNLKGEEISKKNTLKNELKMTVSVHLGTALYCPVKIDHKSHKCYYLGSHSISSYQRTHLPQMSQLLKVCSAMSVYDDRSLIYRHMCATIMLVYIWTRQYLVNTFYIKTTFSFK